MKQEHNVILSDLEADLRVGRPTPNEWADFGSRRTHDEAPYDVRVKANAWLRRIWRVSKTQAYERAYYFRRQHAMCIAGAARALQDAYMKGAEDALREVEARG